VSKVIGRHRRPTGNTNPSPTTAATVFDSRVTRRQMLKGTGMVLGGLAVPGVLESCLGSTSTTASGSIKIGFVSPITGATAGFGEPDPYVIGLAKTAFKNGLMIGGTNYSVEIVTRDSQSTPATAAQVANELIQQQKVDLMLTTSTPETVNPVSDAAEAAGVPCVSTVVPWEAWYLGRGAKPGQPSPFKFSYHFCFGVEQFFLAYTNLWPEVPTNKKVGVMWPNDADGNAIRGALGPLLKGAGYTIIDPGAYEDLTNDYSTQIQTFIRNDCQIFNTFPIPPDFATFWRQASQQGYTSHVKIAQIAKTGLFPSQVEALGGLGNGLASGVYWAPTWPYKSSLTGISSKDLASGYESTSGKQWNQQTGASLALFDVAAALLTKSGDPKNKAKVAATMATLSVDTPVGHLDWSKPPTLAGVQIGNVQTTPIIGGQWKSGVSHWPVDFVICEHAADPNVPVAATLQSYTTG
jgi:branched-chain amino acid transport system substrate-binding protein